MPRKDDIRRHERVPQTAPVQVRWGERPELPWIEKWSQALDSCTFSSVVHAGYDKDRSFLSIEISADEVYFQAISRTGVTVDSRTIRRPMELQSISGSMDPGAVKAKGLRREDARGR